MCIYPQFCAHTDTDEHTVRNVQWNQTVFANGVRTNKQIMYIYPNE